MWNIIYIILHFAFSETSVSFLTENTKKSKDSLVFKIYFTNSERFNTSVLNTKNNYKWQAKQESNIPYIPPGVVEVDRERGEGDRDRERMGVREREGEKRERETGRKGEREREREGRGERDGKREGESEREREGTGERERGRRERGNEMERERGKSHGRDGREERRVTEERERERERGILVACVRSRKRTEPGMFCRTRTKPLIFFAEPNRTFVHMIYARTNSNLSKCSLN